MDDNFQADAKTGDRAAKLVANKLRSLGWKVRELPGKNNFGCDILAITPTGRRHLIEIKSNKGVDGAGNHYPTFLLETWRDYQMTSLPEWRRSQTSLLIEVDMSTLTAYAYNAEKLRTVVADFERQSIQYTPAGKSIGYDNRNSWGIKIEWNDASFGCLTQFSL
jgi:hypothetical protein